MFFFLYLLVQEHLSLGDLYQEHYYHDINQGPSWNSHCVFCVLSFRRFIAYHLSLCFLGLEVNRF